MADFSQIERKLKNLERYMKRDMPRIIGIESVNFFTENFEKGGFVDNNLKKWKPSKRTQPDSVWYGFEYKARVKLPANHPKRKGTKSKYKPRKSNPITNYSPAATKRKTLIGSSGELSDSLQYKVVPGKVIIFSDKKYAKLQNEGGVIKLFGKKSVKIPARKFIGKSKALERKLHKIIKQDIARILQK